MLKKHHSRRILKVVTYIHNYFALVGASACSTSSLSSVFHTTYSADILLALEMIKCNFSGQSWSKNESYGDYPHLQ